MRTFLWAVWGDFVSPKRTPMACRALRVRYSGEGPQLSRAMSIATNNSEEAATCCEKVQNTAGIHIPVPWCLRRALFEYGVQFRDGSLQKGHPHSTDRGKLKPCGTRATLSQNIWPQHLQTLVIGNCLPRKVRRKIEPSSLINLIYHIGQARSSNWLGKM